MFLSNDHEEIKTHLGDGMPRAYGPFILLKLYIPPEIYKSQPETNGAGIIIPQETREKFICTTITGLVLDIGPACYEEDRFKRWRTAQIGEWVIFKANTGQYWCYDNVPLRYVYEDQIYCPVKDPAKVSRD